MIVCICNGLRDEEIKSMCDSCESKQEFTECIRAKMRERSCNSCYSQIVQSFEKSKNEDS